MESRGHCLRLLDAVVCISILATIFFTRCDARITVHSWKYHDSRLQKSPISQLINKLKVTNRVNSNVDPHTINSPFYLPPFDSQSPLPQPDHSPPFTPHSPSNPPPSYGLPTPPPPSYIHSPPANPPETYPPENGFSPPRIFPSPPQHQPSLPKHAPSSPKHVPGQPIYKPPVQNPPPLGPPPPHKGSPSGVWCVAKPTVPDSVIQAAMDYACGSGADCKSIQPNGACFQPNTMIAHASYAFNSYWQNKKGSGGTCDFGGTAMLITVDPGFGKCKFSYN
ncbi:extensin-like [Durio zibethinus]|uniref:Extensin-like n=1 Tax=Durio zibethinus TaxID=66656 RepID=A0A6P6A2Y0_DURZI|nr:extensin-like [Durio zibethinus]